MPFVVLFLIFSLYFVLARIQYTISWLIPINFCIVIVGVFETRILKSTTFIFQGFKTYVCCKIDSNTPYILTIVLPKFVLVVAATKFNCIRSNNGGRGSFHYLCNQLNVRNFIHHILLVFQFLAIPRLMLAEI